MVQRSLTQPWLAGSGPEAKVQRQATVNGPLRAATVGVVQLGFV